MSSVPILANNGRIKRNANLKLLEMHMLGLFVSTFCKCCSRFNLFALKLIAGWMVLLAREDTSQQAPEPLEDKGD